MGLTSTLQKVYNLRTSLLPLLVLAFLPLGKILAEESRNNMPRPVTVGLYVSPPFVIANGNDYSGMAVELWEEIAADLKLPFDYRPYPDFGSLVQATADGSIDIAVTNLTITEDRARVIDFSQPWYDAGLRVMISNESKTGFSAVVSGLRKSGYLAAYAWLAFVIVVATLLLTLFDRRFDKDFPQAWSEGVAESFYSVMSVATSGKAARKNFFGWIGRVMAALWLVCGVAVLAYVTSTVTSVMTTISLTSQINGPADLSGKTVGVFTGSVAERFAHQIGFKSESIANIDLAVDALVQGRIDAIVGDAPVLEYFDFSHPNINVSVVGKIFQPDKYGFGFGLTSDLEKSVTVKLLEKAENGRIETLRANYFGNTP